MEQRLNKSKYMLKDSRVDGGMQVTFIPNEDGDLKFFEIAWWYPPAQKITPYATHPAAQFSTVDFGCKLCRRENLLDVPLNPDLCIK